MKEMSQEAMLAFVVTALLPLYESAEKNGSLRPAFRRASQTMLVGAAMYGLSDDQKKQLRALCELFETACWE